jgi:Flp pilus assembly protein TadG
MLIPPRARAPVPQRPAGNPPTRATRPRPPRRSPAAGKPRRGISALEFGIIGPVFLLFVLGIIEWGRVYMVQGQLTEAARQAVRRGVVEGTTTAQITSTAVNYLQNIGIAGDTVQVVINDGAGNIVEAQNVPPFTELTVVVQVPIGKVTWIPSNVSIYVPAVGYVNVGPTGSLQGQFTMRRE